MSLYENQMELGDTGMLQFLDYWWSKRNPDLHTQLPGKIVSIDYASNSATIQPLITTYINAETTIPFPQCIEVPINLISSGKGGAKITIPLKAGTTGLIKFSERDVTNWISGTGTEIVDPKIKDNLSMGAKLYPVSFEAGLFTKASAIEWDSANIVIDNPGAKVLINGATVTDGGDDFVTSEGISLKNFKAEYDSFIEMYNAHTHSGVISGGGTSGVPVIPIESEE